MADTEIYFNDQRLAFVVGWRQRTGAVTFLTDETGRRADLLPMFEVPENPHGKFEHQTIEALREKFAAVDEVFRELT